MSGKTTYQWLACCFSRPQPSHLNTVAFTFSSFQYATQLVYVERSLFKFSSFGLIASCATPYLDKGAFRWNIGSFFKIVIAPEINPSSPRMEEYAPIAHFSVLSITGLTPLIASPLCSHQGQVSSCPAGSWIQAGLGDLDVSAANTGKGNVFNRLSLLISASSQSQART
jgi:hypothetical protein